MSIPPQLIRVKRKRDDESPVTFLQLDQDAKRHRSGTNWVYQRRPSTVAASGPAVGRNDGRPVIHVSQHESQSSPRGKQYESLGRYDDASKPASPVSTTKRGTDGPNTEPRKFRVSRAMLAEATATQSLIPGAPRPLRRGPTLFVERNARRKIVPKLSRRNLIANEPRAIVSEPAHDVENDHENADSKEERLKKPGIAKRREASREPPTRRPLPESLRNRHDEDMDKIAADMNHWVLSEIGANLNSMEEERRQTEKAKFKPKAPEKRYLERHPEQTLSNPPPVQDMADTLMADASEEEGDGDDWVIEEYVRIPAHTMGNNVLPSDVGILVLDGEEENMLFYGSPDDEDDEFPDDDEDENAENHYTADYPEDEVNSDDEFDRQAYMFRNGNASDDEEFGDEEYESDGVGLDGDDDDVRMDRIRQFMKRNAASR